MEQLHTEDFQERVKRSAEWFESSIHEVFANSIDLAAQIKSNNKQAMSRFPEALADVRQAVFSRRFLLSKIAEQVSAREAIFAFGCHRRTADQEVKTYEEGKAQKGAEGKDVEHYLLSL